MAKDLRPPESGYGPPARGWQLHCHGDWLRKPKEGVYFHCPSSTLWKFSKGSWVRADEIQRLAVGGFAGFGNSFMQRVCFTAWRDVAKREQKWQRMPAQLADVPGDDRFATAQSQPGAGGYVRSQADTENGIVVPQSMEGRRDSASEALQPPVRQGWKPATKAESRWSFNPKSPGWLHEPEEGVYFHMPSKTLWREVVKGGVWTEYDDQADGLVTLRCVDAPADSAHTSCHSLSERMRCAALLRRCFRSWTRARTARAIQQGLPVAKPKELALRIFGGDPLENPAKQLRQHGGAPREEPLEASLKPSERAAEAAFELSVSVDAEVCRDEAKLLVASLGQRSRARSPHRKAPAASAQKRRPELEHRREHRGCCPRRWSGRATAGSAMQNGNSSVASADALDSLPDSPRDLWKVDSWGDSAEHCEDAVSDNGPNQAVAEAFDGGVAAASEPLPMEVLRLESPEDLDNVPETRL